MAPVRWGTYLHGDLGRQRQSGLPRRGYTPGKLQEDGILIHSETVHSQFLGDGFTSAKYDGSLVSAVTHDGNNRHAFAEGQPDESFAVCEVDLVALCVGAENLMDPARVDQEGVALTESASGILMAGWKLTDFAHEGGEPRDPEGSIKC